MAGSLTVILKKLLITDTKKYDNAMRPSIKTHIAILLVISGVVMCYISFYTEPIGEIAPSVLGYFGECLIWAGSVFGIVEYVKFKLNRFN